MRKKYFFVVMLSLVPICFFAQHPFKHWTDAIETRYDHKQPVINYILSIDSTDTSSFTVEMRIRNIPDTFYVAMVAHPEYDDQYWQYVEDFKVVTKKGNGEVLRKDSALWKITAGDNEVVLHYRIHLPSLHNEFRSAWRAFLSPSGGLVGGPHSFMYIVGETLAPSYVTLDIPRSWEIVTGLTRTSDPKTFFAPSTNILVDDPIFVGKFRSWLFNIDDVPHRVVYWSLPNAQEFDTIRLLSGIQKITEQASLLFGRFPYRDFTFMLQDDALGSLEHNNSVTVGAPVIQLIRDMDETFAEIAHEYFHTWNLVRIRPIEYGDVNYQTPPLSKGLWFSEGLTMFYADLLLRRASLPAFDSTRIAHLERLIRRYLASPAYLKYSAEKISLASYGPVGMLGDYSASTHLQGEILGVLLDFIIRDATGGEKSMDDVMRKMLENFSGEKGFKSHNIEETVHQICGCDVHSFFSDYVFGSREIDFNKYLKLAGLQMNVALKDARAGDGKPIPDLRIYSWQKKGEDFLRIVITNPQSCWGKAGLHTGDIIKLIKGIPMKTTNDFRQLIRNLQIGDSVAMEVEKPSGILKINVLIKGYQQPEVKIQPLANASQKQKNLFAQWNDSDTLLKKKLP
jgi:predicted metalloprotease with PDZ domain